MVSRIDRFVAVKGEMVVNRNALPNAVDEKPDAISSI